MMSHLADSINAHLLHNQNRKQDLTESSRLPGTINVFTFFFISSIFQNIAFFNPIFSSTPNSMLSYSQSICSSSYLIWSRITLLYNGWRSVDLDYS